MPPKSILWQYFEKCEDKNFAKCRFCGKKIKTSGNTTNLKCHLDATHKQAITTNQTSNSSSKSDQKKRHFSSITELKNTEEEELPSTSFANIDSDSTSTSDVHDAANSNSSRFSKRQQKTIFESFTEIKCNAQGGRKYTKITNAILFMICRDCHPVNIVENEGFLNLIHTLNPIYKVPSRKAISNLIDGKYEAITSIFRTKIELAENFTLTCDIWTETMRCKSFLGITLHFMENNETTKIIDATLGVYELEERHTAEYIAGILKKLCQEWKVADGKITCVVTDGASNMKKAVDIAFGKKRHIHCFAHILNLVVTKALEQVPEMGEIIKKIRNIVRWFKQSVVAYDMLRKAQGENNDDQLSLRQDVLTRWNSTFYMLERFLKLRVHINAIVNTEVSAPPMPTAMEIQEIQLAVNILMPFESATREISGSKYTTASIVIPMICNLKQYLQAMEIGNFPLAIMLAQKLTAEVDKRLSTADQIMILAGSTVLDPRFKKMYFINPLSCARAVEHIQDALLRPHQNADQPVRTDQNVSQSTETEATGFSLWTSHKQKVAETNKVTEVSIADQGQSEISLYLRNPVEPFETNPLEWWHNRRHVYPSLSVVAKKMLSVLATSVPSERLFSKAGDTVTQKRSSLKGKRLSQFLFLQSIEKRYWDIE